MNMWTQYCRRQAREEHYKAQMVKVVLLRALKTYDS